MSSGANIGDGGPDGIGDNPTDLGAWELFQLGWLNKEGNQGPFYDVAFAGETSQHTLSKNVPATTGGKQALFTLLPDAERPLNLGAPASGSQMFWSTQGDDLNTTMTKTGVSGTNLTAQVNYDIETDWDYAFLEASTDGGTTWSKVMTNLSDTNVPPHGGHNQSGFNNTGEGITGSTAGAWKSLTATLPAGTNAVRFRYQTDGAVAEKGFRVDDIAIDGTTIGTAETATEGWDVRRVPHARPARRSRSSSTPTSRRTVSTTATTRRSSRRTTSGSSAASRTGWRATRTRTGCWCRTGTTPTATTTSVTTPAPA